MMKYRKVQSNERLAFWGESYLTSTEESIRRASAFARRGLQGTPDYFTSYMYLYVAFNNLYSLLGRPKSGQKEKIENAIDALDEMEVDAFYDEHYVGLIKELNDGPPEQLMTGPDKVVPPDVPFDGVANMNAYLFGRTAANWLAHVENVASSKDSTAQKSASLKDLATCLLYTIRNNQFHAIKGAQNLHDVRTVEIAYRLLSPIVESMLPAARREVQDLQAMEALQPR